MLSFALVVLALLPFSTAAVRNCPCCNLYVGGERRESSSARTAAVTAEIRGAWAIRAIV